VAARERHLPFYVTAPLLWPLLVGLRVLGLDVDILVEAAGLSVEAVRNPETRVDVERALALIRAAIEASGDENIGLRLSQLYEPGAFGVLDHLARSARTLREAVDVLCRYERIHQNGMETSLRLEAGSAIIDHRMLHPYPVPRQLSENTIANLLVIGRKLTGLDLTPSEVRFAHPAPPDVTEHAKLFRCPIRWRATSDALVLPAETLDAPLLMANAGLALVLDRYALELLEHLSVDGSFGDKVREGICVELPRGDASVEVVAAKLGMSARTLQRRLSEEGTSHQTLLEELRRSLSEQYLERPDLCTEDVGLMLGFSDGRAFRRAFKRWTGTAPSEFRARRLREKRSSKA
jgi:AraC-like DNA-binding protein